MQESQSFTPHSSSLTEDEVKRRFAPFLRDFYKNRYEPMPNSVSVELDNVSKEGWVADGKITFRKEDGSPFVCTYEATSRDKAEEVKFQLNLHYFLWDCTAFGIVCAALAYVFFYQTDFVRLVELGLVGNIGLLIGVGMIGFFGWYFVMQGWRKYRYIFAIQQFKQYFADEQWVALAEDVFPAPNDPYLLELRNQCVYNGIGLAIVPMEGMVRKVIDPSRLGIFGKDRQMTQWVTRADWYQAFSQNVGNMAARRPKAPDALTALWNKIYRPIHYLLFDPFKKNVWAALRKPVGETSSVYTRFMSAQGVQKWVAFLAVLVTAPLFWQVNTFSDERVADLKELELRPRGLNPEDQVGYLLENETIPADGIPTGVPKQYPVSKNKKFRDEENTINLSGDDEEEEYPGIEDEKPNPKRAPKSATPGAKAPDPCTILQTERGWIVQDNAFDKKESAADRAYELRERGLPCQWASQSCIAADRTGWLVWMGDPYPTEAAAQTAADNFAKAFQRYDLKNGTFLVRRLR
ncbi:MAG: SPOR domain-containing protein [Saprospiraceae bacterium]